MSIATLLLPDFLLIVLGHVLLRVTRWETPFWTGLEKMVYYLLFPALLFNSSANAPLDLGATARLLQVALAVCLAGIVLGWLARPLLRPEPINFASGVQTAFRFNSYIALAAAQRLAGDSGTALMAVLIGFCVPLCNLAAVYALAPKGRSLLRELAKNPLLLATTAGISCNLLGIGLPELLNLTLARIGNTSIVLGLMMIGAGLRFEGLRGTHGLALYFMTIKLLALPALALVLGHWCWGTGWHCLWRNGRSPSCLLPCLRRPGPTS